MSLILISYDSLHAVPVPALVDPIAISKQLPHNHGLAASDAVEGSRSSLVEEKPEIDPPSISLLLHSLSIRECKRLPVGSVLRRRLVLEIAASDDRWAVALSDVNWILGVWHLDSWSPTVRSSMTRWNRMIAIMMNGRVMGSGHC